MFNRNTLPARPALALATATACLAFAATAMAAPTTAAPTVLVRLDAADLSAGDAVTTIHKRIATAARRVCAAEGNSVEEQIASRQCRAKAISAAEDKLTAQREQAKGRQPTLATAR